MRQPREPRRPGAVLPCSLRSPCGIAISCATWQLAGMSVAVESGECRLQHDLHLAEGNRELSSNCAPRNAAAERGKLDGATLHGHGCPWRVPAPRTSSGQSTACNIHRSPTVLTPLTRWRCGSVATRHPTDTRDETRPDGDTRRLTDTLAGLPSASPVACGVERTLNARGNSVPSSHLGSSVTSCRTQDRTHRSGQTWRGHWWWWGLTLSAVSGARAHGTAGRSTGVVRLYETLKCLRP